MFTYCDSVNMVFETSFRKNEAFGVPQIIEDDQSLSQWREQPLLVTVSQNNHNEVAKTENKN